MHKIVLAITGASGSVYPKVLLDKLTAMNTQISHLAVVMSDNAKQVWEFELEDDSHNSYPFKAYAKSDFMAPFASGSAKFDTMVIVPALWVPWAA